MLRARLESEARCPSAILSCTLLIKHGLKREMAFVTVADARSAEDIVQVSGMVRSQDTPSTGEGTQPDGLSAQWLSVSFSLSLWLVPHCSLCAYVGT
jgi:hypothetical protein